MSLPNCFSELMCNGGLIVGLKRHQKRMDYSLGKLVDAGFENIKPHYGCDGFCDPANEILNENGWKLLDAPIRNEPGGIGFTVTTLLLWKKIIDENLPYLLIFEDDVLPHPDIAKIGEEFYNETPKDFDFLFLGNNMDCKVTNKVVSVPCFCTHAYIITNQGAKRAFELIKNDTNGFDKADCQLIVWMNKNLIKYYCWNGNDIKKPYKTSNEDFDAEEDVIWWNKSNGIFYQNYKLGTTIFSYDVFFENDKYIK